MLVFYRKHGERRDSSAKERPQNDRGECLGLGNIFVECTELVKEIMQQIHHAYPHEYDQCHRYAWFFVDLGDQI